MMMTSMLTEHATTTTKEDDAQNLPKMMFCGKQGRYGITILTKKDLKLQRIWSSNTSLVVELKSSLHCGQCWSLWTSYPVMVD